MSRVDVAIPNYNYGRFLAQCVNSVLSQDVDELRVLIIDNASTDDSDDVARALAANDSRIELRLRDKNLGPTASFNEAIDWAQSDYFLILCSDDMLVPGALRRASNLMDAYPNVALTYGTTTFIWDETLPDYTSYDDKSGHWRIIKGIDLIDAFCRSGRNHISGPTAVVRTNVQKRVGYYRPELPHTDDMELWLRFACQGDAAVTSHPQAIARVHSGSQSAQVKDILLWSKEFEAAFMSFFAREGRTLPDASRLHERACRSLGERAYASAISSLLRRDGQARELFAYAHGVCPSLRQQPPIGFLLYKILTAGYQRLMGAKGFYEILTGPSGCKA